MKPKRFASKEPEVIRRLPRGVEYTFVKVIFHDAPAPLTTLSWLPRKEGAKPSDSLWLAFRGKTYRSIDRRLSKEEAAISSDEQRQDIRALRHYFVEQFLGDIGPYARLTNRWMRRMLHHDPAGLDAAALVPSRAAIAATLQFEVWENAGTGPRLLEQQTLSSGTAPWGGMVGWFDADEADRICMTLFRKYFPEIMARRPGRFWRSDRDPAGWQVITQFVIPYLYDYLWPYYPVRHYQNDHFERSAGKYPRQLAVDITDLIRLERPELAPKLTPERVIATIQRYLTKARDDRPMGMALFQLWPPHEGGRT